MTATGRTPTLGSDCDNDNGIARRTLSTQSPEVVLHCVSGRQHSVSALRASRSRLSGGGLPAHSAGARRSRPRAGCGTARLRAARPTDGHAAMRIRCPHPGSTRTRSVHGGAMADSLESGPVANIASANTKGSTAGRHPDSSLRRGLRPHAHTPPSPGARPPRPCRRGRIPSRRRTTAARGVLGPGRGRRLPARQAATGRLKAWASPGQGGWGREGRAAVRRRPRRLPRAIPAVYAGYTRSDRAVRLLRRCEGPQPAHPPPGAGAGTGCGTGNR